MTEYIMKMSDRVDENGKTIKENNMEVVIFSDIVEENGKTIRENNMKIKHNIPIGTLVEVKYNEWGSGGSCAKIHARLWVISHNRDCDGTPLYALCQTPIQNADTSDNFILYKKGEKNKKDIILKNNISVNVIYNVQNGFAEDQLTVIPVTIDIESGQDCLEWENEDE